jgi:pyridoxal phosphate-dependent aminotransferase EpsN
MHLQPVFADCKSYGGEVSARLFADGLCLPSGSSMTEEQRQQVIDGFRAAFAR